MADFQDLGIGVGLRSEYFKHFLNGRPRSVSWVEVISETYMNWSDQAQSVRLRNLQRIRRNVPIALHGISMNLGSADALNHDYLNRLQTLIERIEPIWVSDHLCWTGVDGENLFDLLPVPYTGETLELLTQKISAVQEKLKRRILIENPSSYFIYEHSEMSEWEFLAELVGRADCGILLDVNNVYVSAFNHGFDPLTYLSALPKERVGQIHLAGHSNRGPYLYDTHATPVCDDVWALYRWTLKNIGRVSTMIERDSAIPPWHVLEEELDQAAKFREESHGFVNPPAVAEAF